MCRHEFRFLGLAIVIGVLFALAADAADKKGTKPDKRRQPAAAAESEDRGRLARPPAAERYVVVELDGEIVVRKKSEMVVIRKEQSDTYRAKLKEYNAVKKIAKETGEKLDARMPVRPKIRQFGTSFKTEEDANAHRDKILSAKQENKSRGTTKKGRASTAEFRSPAGMRALAVQCGQCYDVSGSAT
jgi:hypothetical protein